MSPTAHAATTVIRIYQWFVSPLLGAHCRHWPSCSAYAVEAVAVHGASRGGWLALKRLARCHPWGGHGVDPVPPLAPHPLTQLRLSSRLALANPPQPSPPKRGRGQGEGAGRVGLAGLSATRPDK